MQYQFTSKSTQLTSDQIWSYIQNGLSKDVVIKSIKEKKPYNINHISENEISFSAESRNEGKPEIIAKADFALILPGLKQIKIFNTNSSKEIFRSSKIYKKRSPMFALLLSCGVIEKVNW